MVEITNPYTESSMPYRLEKPNIEALLERGYTLVDMHIHTIASDGADAVKYVLDRARSLGIGVAITDHNRIESSVRACRNSKGVMVVPGVEATSSEGRHFLLYFYDAKNLSEFYRDEMRNGRQRLPGDTLIDLKGNYDYLVSVAHPNGFKSWHDLKLDFNILKIDALEILNSKQKLKHAKKVTEWSMNYMKGYTGGTDAHMASEIGKIVTCSLKKTLKEFLDSVKNRETFVVGTFYPMRNKIWDYARFYPLRRLRSTVVNLFNK